MSDFKDEIIGRSALSAPDREISPEDMSILWQLFEHIEKLWFPDLPGAALSIKPQWLDYMRATVTQSPSLLGEYESAARVFIEVSSSSPDCLDELMFSRVVHEETVSTRLDHAKYFVLNPFIRVFAALAGFKAFGGRNFNGYMGGSRFGDTAPVRVGGRV